MEKFQEENHKVYFLQMSAIEKEKEKMNRKNCKKAIQQRLCVIC